MKVFLGSPFKGLEEVRRQLHDALAADHEVLWMEDFGSQEVDALTACLRHVDDADVYILIFGARYGTRLTGSDYSFTQLEYEHAQKTGTPVIAYVQQLSEDESRDAHSEDFLQQVKSSHLLDYAEFKSAEELIEMVTRDLERLEKRLERPKFDHGAPVRDEEAYVIGTLRKKVLRGAPYTVALVDAGAVRDRSYRPEKRGRLGDKVESVERVAANAGATVQVFNDFPVKRKGDVAKLRAERVNANARLIVILIGKEGTADVRELFAEARGERAVFHGDWFTIDDDDDYAESFSDEDLNTCDLRASVIELIEARITAHVTEQLT